MFMFDTTVLQSNFSLDLPVCLNVTCIFFPSAFERAKQCLTAEEYTNILALCDEELENPNTPHLAETLLLRGTFRLLQGQGDMALEDLERVSEIEGAHPTVSFVFKS